MSCAFSIYQSGVRLLALDISGMLRGLSFLRAGLTNVKAVIGGGNSVKEFARKFYSSKAWKNTRAAYAKSRGNLCEVCLAKGLFNPCEIVHHKIELTPQNVNDPNITLDWGNLQCVCRECHADIHDYYKGRKSKRLRYKIDDLGRVTVRE